MLKKKQTCWLAWQAASTNRRIFSGILVVTAMTFLVKCIAAGKELLIAGYFGTTPVVDAFLFAYLLPAFLINLLAGSFSSAVMPTYIHTRDNKGQKAADHLLSSIMILAALFLLVAMGVLVLLGPIFLSILGSGFSGQTLALSRSILYWLLPIIFLTGMGRLFATVINAGEHFALVALAPAMTPVCTICALLVLVDKCGVYALVMGAVSGAGLELLVLIIMAKGKGVPVFPRWYGMTEELRTVIGQYSPMVAGAFLMSSTGLIDQSMAAMLAPGSVATLNYANKVVSMVLGIGSMALGTAVLPHFSSLVGKEDWINLRHTFTTYTRLIIFITVPVTALLCLFSEPIIQLLFQRGAFTVQDTWQVSRTQAFYVLQVPFYLLGILGVRLISSLAKNEILMKVAAISLLTNIICNYLFMQYFGVSGIALSTSVVYVFSTGIFYWYLLLSRNSLL